MTLQSSGPENGPKENGTQEAAEVRRLQEEQHHVISAN